jgi:hypothetical protein
MYTCRYYQGEGSGVTNWISRPDIFPHGNDYLRNATGWPIMGHNRWVSWGEGGLDVCRVALILDAHAR